MNLGKKFLNLVYDAEQESPTTTTGGDSPSLIEPLQPWPTSQALVSEEKFDVSSILNMVDTLTPNDSYAKFQKQCDTLGSFIPNEVDLLKAALASLQSSGITLEQIRSDIRKRQGLLQQIEVKFRGSLDLQKQVMEKCQQQINIGQGAVKQLEAEITQLEQLKAQKQKQIEELLTSAQSHNSKVTEIQQQMGTKTEEFNKSLAEVKDIWQTLLLTKLGGF